MPSLARLEELRDEFMADDLELSDAMLEWSDADASAYFESGGTTLPARAPTADAPAKKPAAGPSVTIGDVSIAVRRHASAPTDFSSRKNLKTNTTVRMNACWTICVSW